MYVCLCYGISDKDIRRAAAEGAHSLAELSARTGCASNCGSCAELASELLADAHAARPVAREFPLPMIAA